MPDFTETVDPLLANYNPSTLIFWITLAVIVVALIALGTEFWVNLWGVIFSPSMTFQRLLGEVQAIPGIVVTAMVGLASAAIVNAYFAKEEVIERVFDILYSDVISQATEQLDNLLDQVGSDLSFVSMIEGIEKFAFQAQTVAIALPIGLLIIWFLWGLAGQLASMIAGNKAGHGLSNLLSAIPYSYLIGILSTWFYMMALAGSSFGQYAGIITSVYFLFLHIILMREHGRYQISKAVISTIITFVLLIVFIVVLIIIVAFIWAQIVNYLG